MECLFEKLKEQLKTFCLQQPVQTTFWIAYSGGLDSHVLLHLGAALQQKTGVCIQAVHINHGLSAHALTWQNHCYSICQDLNVPMVSQTLQIFLSKGQSLEASAREGRYGLLADLLKKGDFLLTAHHEDDQAETILLQLMRGAGVKGLSAMPVLKPLGKGMHYRPFLSYRRSELENYAKAYQLKWLDDESNDNQNFDRNFLRHAVLPILKKRWPSAAKTLARSARHSADAMLLVQELMSAELEAFNRNDKSQLDIKKLLLLSPLKQRFVLRAWFESLDFKPPPETKLQQIIQTVLPAAKDRFPLVTWGHYEVRRFQGTLFARRKPPVFDQHIVLKWNFSAPLILPDGRKIDILLTKSHGLSKITPECEIRFRRGGERCRLVQNSHHSLKHLLQKWQVPPWERNRIPLIFINNELAAVVGFFYDKKYAAKKDEIGIELILT